MLNYLGFEDFNEVRKFFSDPVHEGITTEGQSKLFESYWNRMESIPNKRITQEEFAQYDLNILGHLESMNQNRQESITLKYFQYFSLLFVEIYLDNFFGSREKLLELLNIQLELENKRLNLGFKPYTEKDLNKLAISNATGSGKTLLMHINYMQIKYYLEKYTVRFDGSYILLTPGESLSRQHLEEYEESGIKAERYEKEASRLFSRPEDIQVTENSKLANVDGKDTVSVHRFGNTNILFVDEGHRGSSGDSWYLYRNQLCENGFSFEYSATFSQAMRASNKKELEEEYAKCILFDYSYKYFYGDGFGKDYRILNLPKISNSDIQNIYLTASLLTFYQQKLLFANKKDIYKDYNLENPLMVFVGGKVTATKNTKTDVTEIVSFFNDFLSKPNEKIGEIEQIINGDSPLLDNENKDLFSNRFDYLLMRKLSASKIYDDILKVIFHVKYRGQLLHADNLKGIDGEIRLRVGDNSAFGVINVGSDKDLLKLIAQEGIQTNEVEFASSLFETINNENSTINILVGSKKFSEGWNSWRVSTMGLMNVGKKEGSQIIQLFGRGVRLKGRNLSLKRSNSFHRDFKVETRPREEDFKFLSILETLNIFGLHADYMEQFKNYLSSEGLNPDNETYTVSIPVRKNIYPKGRLKTLKIKDGLNFQKDGPQPVFGRQISKPIVLDTYGKVQFQTSIVNAAAEKEKHVGRLTDAHFIGMDFELIYFKLLEYKKQKKYWNIVFSLADIKTKLSDSAWYKLYIPESELVVKSYLDFNRFTRMGLSLMKKYLDRIYYVSKNEFESPLREYVDLNDEDKNFIDDYELVIENANHYSEIITLFKEMESFVKEESNISLINSKVNSQIHVKYIQKSLYNPLIYINKGLTDIRVTPTSLAQSEWKFITDLTNHIENNAHYFEDKEVYLIRNSSRNGIGFFEEHGFYPDFIMWYFNGDKEHIIFIEPHGMLRESLDSHKVQLYKKIKKLERDTLLSEGVRPVLESFILSPTPFAVFNNPINNPTNYSKEEINKQHVLFMEDDSYIEQLFDVLE